MASFQDFLQHSRAPVESPAKIFAKLKSRVQREIVDGALGYESRAAEVHGGMRTPRRKTADDAIQQEMFFGHGEVTALTLSPISSPRKNIGCGPEDEERLRCVGNENVLKLACTPRQRPLMESTAVSHTDDSSARLADCLVPGGLEAAPGSVFCSSVRTRLRKRKLDEQLPSKANNILPDVDMGYVHCQEKEGKMRDVDAVAQTHAGCVVATAPHHLGTPAKIFAYLKEQKNQRDKSDVQKVTSSTSPDAEWDNQSEVREEPDCPVSREHKQQSPDLHQDSLSNVSMQPVVLLETLVLNSPRVSIPKRQQNVFKPSKWPKGITFPAENEIHLRNWFLRRGHTGLFVDGIRRDNNIAWNSNIITERVSKNVLKTVTGRKYVLVGKIDFDAPSQFPKWFVKRFAHGFPTNWKEIYESYLSESKGLKRGSKTQSEKRSQKPSTSMGQSLLQQKQKSVMASQSCPSSTTPAVQMSRSGRLIKPPLDYWRGGRVILDADMNVTIHDDYNTVIQPKVTPSSTTKRSVSKMPTKNTAMDKAPVNDDCESQESIPSSPLRRKVKAPKHKHHKTKGNVIEKPPSPVNCSLTDRATRSSLKRLSAEKNSEEAEPQASKHSKKTNNQKLSTAKTVKANQQPASSQRSPPVDTSCLSRPLSRGQERENVYKKMGATCTARKSPMNLPRSSSHSFDSSSELEPLLQKLQKKQSKNSRKPQSHTTSSKPVEIATQATAQPKSTRRRAARNKHSSVLDDDAWTTEELRKLQEAVSCHPQDVAGYWTKVAMMVGTRSAEECHKQYSCQWDSQTPAKRASKTKQKVPLKEKVDNAVISARVGTLRRKQQVRDFLEAMPKEDMDDAFSTVYMQSKHREVPSMCLSDDLSMSDHEPLTPKPTGFPAAKTPQCLHFTPGMMGSSSRTNYDDKFVFQLEKRMKNHFQFNVQKHGPKSFSPTASVKKTMRRCGNTENNSFVVWEMFPDKDDQADSGEEEDLYFSECD